MSMVARVAVVGLLASVAVLVGGYSVGKRVPSLQAPITIETASALADGGSVHVVLRDAKNRRYAIGVEGSLDIPASSFRVYVQPWFSVLPVPVYVAKNSQEELALLLAVDTWSNQLTDSQPGAELLSQVARVLRGRRG